LKAWCFLVEAYRYLSMAPTGRRAKQTGVGFLPGLIKVNLGKKVKGGQEDGMGAYPMLVAVYSSQNLTFRSILP
jgi:hypothetical protein